MQAGDGYHAWIDIEQLLAMKDLMTGCRLPLQHLSQQKCSLAFRCGGGTADDKPAVIAMPHIKFMDLCVHLHEWRSICRVISVFVSMPVGSSAVCPAFDDIITILILFSHRHACMHASCKYCTGAQSRHYGNERWEAGGNPCSILNSWFRACICMHAGRAVRPYPWCCRCQWEALRCVLL